MAGAAVRPRPCWNEHRLPSFSELGRNPARAHRFRLGARPPRLFVDHLACLGPLDRAEHVASVSGAPPHSCI